VVHRQRLGGELGDDELRRGIDIDPLAMDADAAEAAAIIAEDVPFAAVAAFGRELGSLRPLPGPGIAGIADVVDPPAGNDLPSGSKAGVAHHLAEAGEVAQRDADAARRPCAAEAVDGGISVELRAHGLPERLAQQLGIGPAAGALEDPAHEIG